MKTQMLFVAALSAATLFTGCGSLDTGAVANAGIAAASASKGGNKAGAAVAVGAAGVNAASAIAASRNESKPADGTAQPQQQTATPPSGAQSTATQTATTAQPVAVTAQPQPVAATAQPKPQPPPPAKKPQYTVAQYRAAFAKRTPEQIADYIKAIYRMTSAECERSGFDRKTALKALTPLNGIDVAWVFEQREDFSLRSDALTAIYPQFNDINTQADIKSLIPKMSFLSKIANSTLKRRVCEIVDHSGWVTHITDYEFQKLIVEKITDPAIADYMLSSDPVIDSSNLTQLVQKLSEAKKKELYDAALKRAVERKDRIVMEGYYVDMPVLDYKILNHKYGFDQLVKSGGKQVWPIMYSGDSTLVLSKQMVESLIFNNKAWIKFMDCEDQWALVQVLHQYVEHKTGKPTIEDIRKHSLVIQLDFGGEDGEVQVYSNARLSTKIKYCQSTGMITFLEL